MRISPKKDKPCPKIVNRHGKQDEQIKDFLEYRLMLKKLVKSLNGSELTTRGS